MNAAWCGISEMNEVSMCLSAGHKTVKNILKAGAFTVSRADTAHVAECDYFGIATGNKVKDKIAAAGLTVSKSELVNAPITFDPFNNAYHVIGEKQQNELAQTCADSFWILGGNAGFDIVIFLSGL